MTVESGGFLLVWKKTRIFLFIFAPRVEANESGTGEALFLTSNSKQLQRTNILGVDGRASLEGKKSGTDSFLLAIRISKQTTSLYSSSKMRRRKHE